VADLSSSPDSGRVSSGAATDVLAAKRYALAAFDLAKGEGYLDAWQESLDQIAQFMSEPEVRRVLENTRVTQEPRQGLIDVALADLPALPLNLARLLVRKNRTALAPAIAAQFRKLVEEDRGITRAKAVTAVPLNDVERQALVDRLEAQTGNQIILEVEVDPSLMGGLVVQMGDRLVDYSTRARLQALRESLTGAV
jgi:F-type H+-transporting ATPase subunit delta